MKFAKPEPTATTEHSPQSRVEPQDDETRIDEDDGISDEIDDDASVLDETDLEGLLDSFDDADDGDDAEASDLDADIQLEELGTAEEDDDETPQIDVSDVLGEPAEEESAASDETGPEQIDLAQGIDAVDEAESDDDDANDDAEGTAEPLDNLIATDLPAVDADEDGEWDVEAPTDWLESNEDDDAPAAADAFWPTEVVRGKDFFGQAVLRAGSSLLAAGTRLERLIPGPPQPIGNTPRNTILTIVASSDAAVFYATVGGRLFCQPLDGSAAELITAWRNTAGLGRDEPGDIELAASSGDEARVFLMTGKGQLLSTRNGREWMREPIEGSVAAVDANARYLVTQAPQGAVHRRRDDVWEPTGATVPIATRAAGGSTPRLVSDGPRLAIIDGARRLLLSTDEGESFQPIPGPSSLTAVALGTLEGAPVVFVATQRETAATSEIFVIDAELERSRIFSMNADPSDDDPVEAVTIHGLCWDADTRSLYATGAFGVTRLIGSQ